MSAKTIRRSHFHRSLNRRLNVLRLEERAVPAVVANLNDSGSGSLRQAIINANFLAGPETITFQSGLTGTINLASELSITDEVTITGPGAKLLTLNGINAGRILNTTALAKAFSLDASGLTLTGSKVTGSGGAILADDDTISLSDCSITNNSASTGGGGIAITAAGSLTLTRCTIASNTATSVSNGGGVLFKNGGSLLIDMCTLSGNSSSYQGGGVYFNGTVGAGGLTIQNSTLSGNRAGGGGAGVEVHNVTGTLVVQNSTIVNNTTATYGIDRLGNNSTVTITSSIVAGNSADPGPDIYSTGKVNVNYSAIGSSKNFTATGGNNIAPGTNLLLGVLADNGGPTQTIMPFPESPCISAGSNPASLGSDQRGTGYARLSDSGIDIGAVETSDLLVRNTNDAGPGSLRNALNSAYFYHVGPDTIQFDPAVFNTAKTILLTSGELKIPSEVSIIGPGANLLTVHGNNASRVFAIDLPTSTQAVAMSGLTITGGKATDGAGISVRDAVLTLTNCAFINNSATATDGGGVFVRLGGSLIARGCTFSGNKAVYGGAIDFYGSSGTLLLENSTLVGNSAQLSGGACYFFNAGNITIRNSTIIGNACGGSGGGIYHRGSNEISFLSSIVSGNSGAYGPDCNSSITVIADYCAFGSSDYFTMTGEKNLPFQPVADLKLGNLDYYGGPTQTVPLLPGSPALDAGFAFLATDQRGQSRVAGIDIGAFESQGFTLTKSGSGQSAVVGNAFSNPLAVTVNANNAVEPVDGGMVTFTAPTTGASATLSASTVTIAGSSAAVNATANATVGNYQVVATANGADSATFALTNTIAAPPTVAKVDINNGSSQRSRITSIAVTFDSHVTLPANAASAFELMRQSDNAVATMNASVDDAGPGTVVTLTFLGTTAVNSGSLADGRYTLTALANAIANPGGQLDGNKNGTGGDNFVLASAATGNPPTNIFRLFGDNNGDGTVNGADFLAFRLSFLGTGAKFDFDGDGQVSGTDFLQFRLRFLASV